MRFNSHHKVTFVLSCVVATILISLYFYLDHTFKAHTYQRIKTVLAQEISLVKVYLDELSSDADFDVVADDLGKKLSSRVTVIGRDGTVLGDSLFEKDKLSGLENHLSRPEVHDALKNGHGESQRLSYSAGKSMLYFATVFGDSRWGGIVRLAMPLTEIDAVSLHLQKFLWFALAISFVFAFLVSHFASVMITRPVARISCVASAIASGDFSQKLLLTQNDEISDLAKAVNFMSEQIQVRMQEVVKAKSRLEAVFLSMVEGVMVVNPDGRIMLINETLKKILRVDHQAQGRKPLEVIRNIEVHQIVEDVLKTSSGVNGRELVFLLPEEKILRVCAAPVLSDGKIEGVVLVFHDITDLRRLEKVRKDFVANVSHEFRTPVTSIKGYAETLLDGAMDDEQNAKDFLKIIYSESDRLVKLVDDLLVLARYESGQFALNPQFSDVQKVLGWVLSGLAIQVKQSQVAVTSKIPEGLARVKIDESSLAQVLLNLIENAVKYNNPRGEVTISASEKSDGVEILVADTGLGIPAEDLPRIFERFYRVDKAHSRQISGTGLGLSIVKHIVESYGGIIRAESQLGSGSVFCLTLPKA